QALLGVVVIRIQLQRCSEFLLSLVKLARADIHHAEVLVQMRGFGALAAELKGFLHLGESLGPILCVRCLEGKITELLYAVGDLLVLLKRVVAILILLCIRIVRFPQSAGQIVESLGIVGIGLKREFPMSDRLSCFSLMFEILAEEKLCVWIARLKSDHFFEKLGGAIEIVVLLRREGEEVEGGGMIGLQTQRFFELLTRVSVFGGFEIEAAQIVVNGRRAGIETCGL